MDIDAYHISVEPDKIVIKTATPSGAMYATTTLVQILKNKKINLMEIDDWPDLRIRGVMIDISRSKVPKLETLKHMCYELALMKINHIELYVEGFSFEYKSFLDEININKNYITLDEYLELEEFCQKFFIDLVPNENGFGHMADWLALDKYHHLAECEDGFFIWGAHRPPSTLDFKDPKSLELVKALYKDMIPHFKSKYFNMDFDEPIELGKGKNKEYVEKHGEANAYLEYFNKLCDEVKSYGKTPMLWGDVLIKHPESLKKIPKDVIFIDWGYDHLYNFESHGKMLEENNIPFMTAPGTITWGTVVGKDVDMIGSIKNAAIAAKNHHGLGLLITDWGDFGHLQYLPSSIPGFLYGACMAWSNLDVEEIESLVISNIGEVGKISLELSSYSSLDEYRSYGNKIFTPIMYAEHAARYGDEAVNYYLNAMKNNIVSKEVHEKYLDFFNTAKDKLLKLDCDLKRDELLNSVLLLLTLNDIDYKIGQIIDGKLVNFDDEMNRLDIYSKEHQRLWYTRNKENGFKLSIKRIEWLKDILVKIIERKENEKDA